MPGAIIVANQATGAGAGTPGVARKDLWQSQAINLVVGTGSNTSIEWSMLDKPVGSGATISNASQSGGGPYVDAIFTPDLVGTYRVQLVTNGGGPGNVQVLVLRVRYNNTGVLANRGWAYPAKGEIEGESNYAGNLKAWGEVLETIFEDIRTSLGNAVQGPFTTAFTGVSGTQNTEASSWVTIGALVFDGATFVPNLISETATTVTFSAVMHKENVGGMSCEVRLYNVTDGEVVTGSVLSSTDLMPTEQTAAMTLGAAAGNIKTARKVYLVQIQRVAGGPTDNVFCHQAQLIATVT